MSESQMITSPANERLKQVRRVREGREPEWMFIEGERLIESCLLSSWRLQACYHSLEPTPRSEAILSQLRQRECPTFAMDGAVLSTVSDTVTSQGIILIAERPHYTLERALEAGLIVGMEAVQDPGNFGSIIRTAEAAGVGSAVALRGCVDAFSPKTLRGAMGSAFRLPISTDLALDNLIGPVRARGLRMVATRADAGIDYTEYDWRIPTIVFFGNEGNGIGPQLMQSCDAHLRIPLSPPVESLNVAAAAAVILFEAARQRRAG